MSKMRKTVPQIDSGIPIPPVVEDLIGQKFGRLLVIERAENYVFPNGTTASRWLCRCDCGRKKSFWGKAFGGVLPTPVAVSVVRRQRNVGVPRCLM